MRADQIVDINGAAGVLGISRAAVVQRIQRGDFPPPAGKVGISPYWWRLDIMALPRNKRPRSPENGSTATLEGQAE